MKACTALKESYLVSQAVVCSILTVCAIVRLDDNSSELLTYIIRQGDIYIISSKKLVNPECCKLFTFSFPFSFCIDSELRIIGEYVQGMAHQYVKSARIIFGILFASYNFVRLCSVLESTDKLWIILYHFSIINNALKISFCETNFKFSVPKIRTLLFFM